MRQVGDMMGLIGIILVAIATVNSVVCLIEWCSSLIKEISNKDKKQMEQIVYKIEKGDLVGDIKGENIIVILMKGDVNGDISSKEGDVVLIKGDINGDVKANKVICQQQKSEEEDETSCYQCAWFNSETGKCKSWDVNEGECHFIDKNEMEKRHDDFIKDFKKYFKEPPPDYVNCADCIYGEKYSIAGKDYYKCPKFGLMQLDTPRLCDVFKEKKRNTTCKSCYHFVKGIKNGFCSRHSLEKLTNCDSCCQFYDGTGETAKYQVNCARFSNNIGLCHFFCSHGCAIKNGCPYKIERKENSNLK